MDGSSAIFIGQMRGMKGKKREMEGRLKEGLRKNQIVWNEALKKVL